MKMQTENPLLVGLNDGQLKAVTTVKGNNRINACAGAGKTRVLVNRVAHMILDHNIDPSEILMTTFTKKASEEMKERLAKLLPAETINQITIGTSHSIGYRILHSEYKNTNDPMLRAFPPHAQLLINWEQKKFADEIRKRLIKDRSIDKSVRDNIEQIGLTGLVSVISFYRNKGYDADMFLSNMTPTDRNMAYYEFFNEYEYQKQVQKRLDMDDMLYLFVKMLKENEVVLKKYQKKFKYLLIDESQDNNYMQYELIRLLGFPEYNLFVVGDDDQCVIEGTEILTNKGSKRIEDINIGDTVLTALANGKTSYQTVLNKSKSEHNALIKITTVSGKVLKVTPEHKMFALPQEKLNGEQWYIYLMWRKDLGFRVGITCNTLSQRIRQQTASKMWIIDTATNIQDAIYKEELYSLKYQLAKITYNLSEMGKENTDRIFKEFGNNGFQLLDDKCLDFQLPHLQTQATIRHNRNTINVNVLMGGVKHSHINIDTTDKKAIATLEMMGFNLHKSKEIGKRLRINSKDYKQIHFTAKRIEKEFEKHDINFKMNYKAGFVEGAKGLKVINASGIYEGMEIAIIKDRKIELEKVLSKEVIYEENTFYDIETEITHNFIANDIVVHNCMYSFRGAEPDQFIKFTENYNNVNEINLNINYRSKADILLRANKLISNNTNRIVKSMIPASTAEEKAVTYNHYNDEMEESEFVAEEVQILNDKEDIKYKNMAVLFRTNKQSLAIENALIMKGIPYILHGGLSFYERKEVKDIISYLQLIYNTDNNKAFERVINVPSRFLGKAFITRLKEVKRTSLYDATSKIRLKNYEESGVREFKSLIAGMRNMANKGDNITDIVDYLLDSGYKQYLLDDENEHSESRMENVETLKYLLTYFDDVESFLQYVDKMTGQAKHNIDGVQLMTIHKSKGLEFDTVFGIGVSENLLPHYRSLEKADEQEQAGELPIAIEEERRLAYVMVTRAEKRCYVSSTEYYNGKPAGVSRFIEELGFTHSDGIEHNMEE